MLDHLLFHKAYWINRTDDVKAKLNNYDSLKSFRDNIIKTAPKIKISATSDEYGVTFTDAKGNLQEIQVGDIVYLVVGNNGALSLTRTRNQ